MNPTTVNFRKIEGSELHARRLATMPGVVRTLAEIQHMLNVFKSEEKEGSLNYLDGVEREYVTQGQFEHYAASFTYWLTRDEYYIPGWTCYPTMVMRDYIEYGPLYDLIGEAISWCMD